MALPQLQLRDEWFTMEVPFTVVVHFPCFLDLLQYMYFHCCLRKFRFQFEGLSVKSSVILNFLVGYGY